MSTSIMPKNQLGKTSGVIFWKGRIYPRTFDFPYLVFDLDAWARDCCASLLSESEAAFLDRDIESSDAFENMAMELSLWLKTHNGIITSDEALQARSRVKPFVVNAQNFESWMNRLVDFGHELENPELDFILLADTTPPVLYSVTTQAAVAHSGPYVTSKLVDKSRLEDIFGALVLTQSNLSKEDRSLDDNDPLLHMPITERSLHLLHKVINSPVPNRGVKCKAAK